MNLKSPWVRLGLLVLVLGVAIFLILIEFPREPEPRVPPELSVSVTLSGLEEAPGEVRVGGVLEPARRATPAPQIGAQVVSVPVSEGQDVAAGQLLVRLDDRDIRAGAAAAEQRVAQAERAVEEAQRNVARLRRLYEEDLVARVQLEEAELREAEARAGLQAARAQRQEAQTALESTTIRTPFSGTVTAVLVEVGDLAAPGRPVAVVEDRSHFRAIVAAGHAGIRLAPGTTVPVELPSPLGEVDGEVIAVLPTEPEEPGVRAEVRIPPVPALVSGATVTVGLPAPEAVVRQYAIVPEDAIVRRGQLEGVYALDRHVEPGQLPVRAEALLRWIITTPHHQPGFIRILSGIEAGVPVVVGPEVEQLWNGRPVVVESIVEVER